MKDLISLDKLLELFKEAEEAKKAYDVCDISDIEKMLKDVQATGHAFSEFFEDFKKLNNLNAVQARSLLTAEVEENTMNIIYKQNSSNQGLVSIVEHDGWFYVFVEECEYDSFSNFQDALAYFEDYLY